MGPVTRLNDIFGNRIHDETSRCKTCPSAFRLFSQQEAERQTGNLN